MVAATILYIANFAFILPISTGAIRFNSLTSHFKKFFYFLIFSALFELLLFILYSQNIRNDWVVHLYSPVEFFFICLVLRSWNFNPKIKQVINYIVPAALGLWTLYFFLILFTATVKGSPELFTKLFGASEPITSLIEAALLTAFSTLLLSNMYSQRNLIPLGENKKFWFSVAILIYFTGNMILNASLNIIVRLPKETMQNLWIIHSVFNFITYMFLAIAFLCKR